MACSHFFPLLFLGLWTQLKLYYQLSSLQTTYHGTANPQYFVTNPGSVSSFVDPYILLLLSLQWILKESVVFLELSCRHLVTDVTCLPCSLTYVELPGTKSPPEFCPQGACECCWWTGHQGTAGVHGARSSSFTHMPRCPIGLHLQSTHSKTKLLTTSRWWRQSI